MFAPIAARVRCSRLGGALLAGVVLLACGSDPEAPVDAGLVEDTGVPVDSGLDVDAGVSLYTHVSPPVGAADPVLQGDRWRQHLDEDVLPFWRMPAAFGTPEGNFPTYRSMVGAVRGSTERRPRMLARQTYAYSMGFLLTGEPRLLELAHAGMTWLRTKAVDPRGGCHERLDADGNAINGPKFAQDLSYCALGFGAYGFVTRDPEAEATLLGIHDLLFDPTRYYDEATHRIRDGRSADLSTEVDQENDGGWELVAQLDVINAYLLLSQPVFSDPARRDQALSQLRRLGQTMIDLFWADGIFWGVSTKKGMYGTRHVDFGHTLKSYWMLLQIDKRLPDHPFHDFVINNVYRWVDRAYDSTNGRWGKRPVTATLNEWGSDWWIYAEADQLAATLDLIDGRYLDERTQTQAHWLSDYVDTRRAAREIIPGIRQDGSPVYGWPDDDTAKCNEWKNGFHSVEHALVLHLIGRWREDRPVELHFAVPEAEVNNFVAKPYVFDGREVSRTPAEVLTVGGRTLRHVVVTFDQLY